MRQSNIRFDKNRDVQEVDQFGFVDLVKAFQNGYVPGDLEGDDSAYNDIEDPSSIVGKPHDPFEAMRMQDSIVKSVQNSEAAKPSSTDEK